MGSDGADDFDIGVVRVGAHLFVGAVLDGMGHEDRGGGEAERRGLSLGRLDELGRGDEEGRNATALEISDVVHTARRAAASIGERFDHDVTPCRDLVAQIDRRRLGEGRFVETLDPPATLVE